MNKNWLMLWPCVLSCSCFAAGGGVTITDTQSKDMDDSDRFSASGDNYVLLQHRMSNKGWASSDESAMRAHYGLRYLAYARPGVQVFLGYTGEFDFYVGTRSSGPVINRLSNPALFFRSTPSWLPPLLREPGSFLELGFQHESDGQVQDVTTARGIEIAQRAYNEQDRSFFDQIGRGSNFASAGVSLGSLGWGIPAKADLTARVYFSQDFAVTWGPLASKGVKLSDFNRVSANLRVNPLANHQIAVGWTIGDMGLATDSINLSWKWTIDKSDGPFSFSLPLYVRYHRGPFNTLSNYSQRQDSWGLGLDFSSR